MNVQRDVVERRLRSIKEPIAQPLVQTMDMGIQYFVLSSDGAADVLGTLGAWPVFGPFALSNIDLEYLQQAVHSTELDSIVSYIRRTSLSIIQERILAMFDYIEAWDTEFDEHWRLAYQKKFLESICPMTSQQDVPFFIYFHEYETDLPLVFKKRAEIIQYFVTLHNLTPWDQMDIGELESWSAVLDSDNHAFYFISPK